MGQPKLEMNPASSPHADRPHVGLAGIQPQVLNLLPVLSVSPFFAVPLSREEDVKSSPLALPSFKTFLLMLLHH